MKRRTNYDYHTSDGSRETFSVNTLEQLRNNSAKYKQIIDALYGGWVHYAHNGRYDLTQITKAHPEVKPNVIHQLYKLEKDFIPKDNAGFGCGSDGYKLSLGSLARLSI